MHHLTQHTKSPSNIFNEKYLRRWLQLRRRPKRAKRDDDDRRHHLAQKTHDNIWREILNDVFKGLFGNFV